MNTTWKKIAFNIQNVKHQTERAFLIAMPHNSDFDGFQFWVSVKLVREGSHSYERRLSIKDDMVFKLQKTGKGKHNKFEVIAEKEITAGELAEAFGGYVENAGYTSKIDPFKEEVERHVPEKLEPIEAEANQELVR